MQVRCQNRAARGRIDLVLLVATLADSVRVQSAAINFAAPEDGIDEAHVVRLTAVFAVLFMAGSILHADGPVRLTQPLWLGRAPGSTAEADGDVPELIVTQVKSETPTAAVVIFPGGGYHGHAMDHEGYQFAQWFESLGVLRRFAPIASVGKATKGTVTVIRHRCWMHSARCKHCEHVPRS